MMENFIKKIKNLTEQLVIVTAERDAEKGRADKAEAERDAAMNNIPHVCYYCKHKPEKETPKDDCGCQKCGCGCDVSALEIRNAQLCHWEWLGIIKKEQKS